MADADWDLGQKLIEQGACSMDQIRELLSLQDRLRKMGAASKPFARVLLEKGYAKREQLIKAGARESDLPAVEEKPVAAAPKPGSKKPLLIVIAAFVLVGLVLSGRALFPGTPPVEGVDPVREEELDRNAKAHLDQIAALAAKSADFENAADVVTRYEAFLKAQKGKKWESEAAKLLKGYKARAEVPAKAELEELLAAEPPLREQQRWQDLLALYAKYPARFLETTDSGGRLRERIRDVTQRLTEIYSKDKAEVEDLLKAGKLSDALARVKSMELTAPAERKDDLFALRARVERESRGVAEKARQSVADAYFKIDGPYREAMSRRDGNRAGLVIREFLVAPWKPEQLPFVRVRGVDYDALLKCFEPWEPGRMATICEAGVPETDSPDRLGTGEGALLALRNAATMSIFMRTYKVAYDAAVASKEFLDLPALGAGHFDKRDGKTVFIVKTGEVLEPDTSPLGEDDLASLVLRTGPEEGAVLACVGFFYFFSCPDKQKEAFTYLTRAALRDVHGVKLYLGGLGVAAESELKRRLETKFGAAQDLFKGGRRPQAKKLLGELLDYPDHPFTKTVRPEIEKMLYEIAEGSDREKKLFAEYKTKVEVVGETQLKVTYDFEGREQQDAFEVVGEEGARKFKGRWQIESGAMESGTEASVLRWKTPVQGDVAVEYDLTPVDDPQNIVLDLCWHSGKSDHYAVVFAFDWVGKRDGDRDNTAEERFGMPRSCIIKYPVSVEKARWTEAETWEGWKSRLVGKGGAPWKPTKGIPARIRVDRKGRALSVRADGAVVWEGEDGDYTEGRLLFYSDSRCRIDNLSITFKP